MIIKKIVILTAAAVIGSALAFAVPTVMPVSTSHPSALVPAAEAGIWSRKIINSPLSDVYVRGSSRSRGRGKQTWIPKGESVRKTSIRYVQLRPGYVMWFYQLNLVTGRQTLLGFYVGGGYRNDYVRIPLVKKAKIVIQRDDGQGSW